MSNLVTNVGQPSPNITMGRHDPASVAGTVLAALAAFALQVRFIPTTFYAGLAISVLTLVCWARAGIAS